MGQPLQGSFAPPLVPLASDGSLNESELRRYIRWLIDHRIDGLFLNGSTGEFVRLAPEDRTKIVRIACEENRGRVPVIACAGETTVRQTLALCEEYRQAGVSAV